MNNTKKGNELRDRVFNLLSGLKKRNCKKEHFVGGKKADIYYEEIDFFNDKVRCVIECKNYSKKLTNTNIKSIINEYHVEKSNFDKLFILSQLANELTTQMQQTLQNYSYIKVCSYAEFQSILIDFSQYLSSSRLLFKDEGLDQYYVPLSDSDDNDLNLLIDSWMIGEDDKPIAILAGYGMGKTCFALNLVDKYAKDFLEGGTGRIPIYIKLGDIVDKTSIESLICTMFSSTYTVHNFTYPTFKELNRQGFLLIIYDGFDEMKHAMTSSVFREMFIELNTLVEQNAKVLLLGRPNSFLSESEQNTILHGMEIIGDTEITDPDLIDYKEVEIKPFSRQQTESFLKHYLSYLQTHSKRLDAHQKSEDFFKLRLNELLNDDYKELINRPVHAKMLAKLAFSTNESLNIYGRFHLYKKFIQMFFDREMSKLARENISSDTRREFIQDTAWRLWKDGGRRSFSSKELEGWERNYFEPDLLNRNIDILRELLTGSILERKQNNYYYFSHRSFQEYLVAAYLLSKNSLSDSDIDDIAKAVNSEILEFIEEGDQEGKFARNILESLKLYNGYLSNLLIRYIVKHFAYDEHQISDDIFNRTPWHAFINSIKIDEKIINERILANLANAQDGNKLNYLASLLALLDRNSSSTDITRVVTIITSALHLLCLDELYKVQINKGKIVSGIGTENQAIISAFKIMVKTFNPLYENGLVEARSIRLNPSILGETIVEELRQYMQFQDSYIIRLSSHNPTEIIIPITYLRSAIETYYLHHFHNSNQNPDHSMASKYENNVRDSLRIIRRFWGARPTESDVVPIIKTKESLREKLSLKKPTKRQDIRP